MAIRLPSALAERVLDATRRLREVPGVRWGRHEQLHLTLRFLGEVGVDRVDALSERLVAVAHASRPFELELEGAGAFPSVRRARVVWAGVRPAPELVELHGRLEHELERSGFDPEERPFRPHVTLGRVRGRAPRELAAEVAAVALSGRTIVTSISLMQSRLGPGGARHTELAAPPLGPG